MNQWQLWICYHSIITEGFFVSLRYQDLNVKSLFNTEMKSALPVIFHLPLQILVSIHPALCPKVPTCLDDITGSFVL